MNAGKKHPSVATVTALSVHLDCSREQVQRLEKQGVIERRLGGGFDMDECRVRVLRHLRERRPPGEFRNRYEAAKAKREERRSAQEEGKLIPRIDVDTVFQTLTALSFAAFDAVPPRLHPQDVIARRNAAVEIKVAKECVSIAFKRLADNLAADPLTLLPTDIGAIRARLFPGRSAA